VFVHSPGLTRFVASWKQSIILALRCLGSPPFQSFFVVEKTSVLSVLYRISKADLFDCVRLIGTGNSNRALENTIGQRIGHQIQSPTKPFWMNCKSPSSHIFHRVKKNKTPYCVPLTLQRFFSGSLTFLLHHKILLICLGVCPDSISAHSSLSIPVVAPSSSSSWVSISLAFKVVCIPRFIEHLIGLLPTQRNVTFFLIFGVVVNQSSYIKNTLFITAHQSHTFNSSDKQTQINLQNVESIINTRQFTYYRSPILTTGA
jgi:hypothetical protein